MKSDSRIVDARRRARAVARSTGRSYQQTLDEIARSAGRDGWEDFVAHPCDLPAETIDIAPEAAATPTASTDAVPTMRRSRTGLTAFVVLIVLAFAGLAWSRSQAQMEAARNAGLAWERTTAVSSRMRSRYRDNDRAMYVLATPLLGDRRDVRLVIIDNRPASNGVAIRMMIATGLIDRGTTVYTEYGGGNGIFRVFERHPVARLHLRADCRTGMTTYVGSEVADDMTSSPIGIMAAYHPVSRKVDDEDLQAMCSTDTLDRTARIRRGF